MTKSDYCSKCKSRKWRKENPIRSAYLNLRNNAKRRKKHFDISYWDFKIFVAEVDYIAKKGIHGTSMHIDRHDERLGYTKENIRPLENRQNIRKYLDYYWCEYRRKMIFKTKTIKNGNNKTVK